MRFYGRKRELTQLKKLISSDDMLMGLIYGRRRIGKSELVKQAIKESGIKSIFYECRQVTEESNVQSMCEVLSDVLGLPKLGYMKAEEIIDYIFKLSKEESIVFVLDEYPYLRENVKGLDSIIQALVDKYRENSKLKLIVLGSYVEVMKSLLKESNPLYGRTDLVIDLKQMDYYLSNSCQS